MKGIQMKGFRKIAGWASLLAALVAVQTTVVIGGNYYVNTGGTVDCLDIGGPNCNIAAEQTALPCDNNFYTMSDLSERGWSSEWPCAVTKQSCSVPKPNSTSGNQNAGSLAQGYYPHTCTVTRECTKTYGVIPPGHLTVGCKSPTLTPCTSYTIFTAGGGVCPAPGSGGGGS